VEYRKLDIVFFIVIYTLQFIVDVFRLVVLHIEVMHAYSDKVLVLII